MSEQSSLKQVNHPGTPSRDKWFISKVLIKALLLLIIANILFAIINPLPNLGRFSLYNHVFPGRQRLPYGDHPGLSYNLTLNNLEAMFASHEIAAGRKPDDEYRVILIGDSATWGYLQQPEQTLSSQINQLGITLPDGRRVKAYNLGYPVMSLLKDLLILSRAITYEPDLIVWLVTLESFPDDKQLFAPLLQYNPQPVRQLIDQFNLAIDSAGASLSQKTSFDQTIIGSRRDLADLLRLQIYGAMWAATGIDQDISEYTPLSIDLSPDDSFHKLQPPQLDKDDLALQILEAGIKIAGDTPLALINEPIFISAGENSHIRYNFYYPRWAYDDYRQILSEIAEQNNWEYHDMWDVISPNEFTNTAIHLSPQGALQFAARIASIISRVASSNR